MPFDLSAYLHRIRYAGPVEPTARVLRDLHRAHVLSVPFENLDIHLGRPIRLDEDAFFDKIVRQRRGGFCYEVNGLFAKALMEIGFDIELLSARVYSPDGIPGRDFAHVLLRVKLPQHHIADVGFGDASPEPLLLESEADQPVSGGAYRLVRGAEGITLNYVQSDGALKAKYVFTLAPRVLSDFAGMCHNHQTEPTSMFVRRRLCTRATPTGRITLAGTQLIVTQDGQRTEIAVTSDEHYSGLLREHFAIDISPGAWRLPLIQSEALGT